MADNAKMQGNLSIKFPKKSETKWAKNTKSYASSSNKQKTVKRQKKEQITSAAYLRHRDGAPKAKVKDPKKLIKKDELPVKIIPLGGLDQIGINSTLIEYKNDIVNDQPYYGCALHVDGLSCPGPCTSEDFKECIVGHWFAYWPCSSWSNLRRES